MPYFAAINNQGCDEDAIGRAVSATATSSGHLPTRTGLNPGNSTLSGSRYHNFDAISPFSAAEAMLKNCHLDVASVADVRVKARMEASMASLFVNEAVKRFSVATRTRRLERRFRTFCSCGFLRPCRTHLVPFTGSPLAVQEPIPQSRLVHPARLSSPLNPIPSTDEVGADPDLSLLGPGMELGEAARGLLPTAPSDPASVARTIRRVSSAPLSALQVRWCVARRSPPQSVRFSVTHMWDCRIPASTGSCFHYGTPRLIKWLGSSRLKPSFCRSGALSPLEPGRMRGFRNIGACQGCSIYGVLMHSRSGQAPSAWCVAVTVL